MFLSIPELVDEQRHTTFLEWLKHGDSSESDNQASTDENKENAYLFTNWSHYFEASTFGFALVSTVNEIFDLDFQSSYLLGGFANFVTTQNHFYLSVFISLISSVSLKTLLGSLSINAP